MPFINEAVWALHDGRRRAGGDRHDREARLQPPDRAARARRPDRPRHVRGDHGGARVRARRRALRAVPAAARARRRRAGSAARAGRGFYDYASTSMDPPNWGIQRYPFSVEEIDASEANARGDGCASCLSTTIRALRKLLSATLDGVRPRASRRPRAPPRRTPRSRGGCRTSIVLDVAMPGTDGLELCRRLKAAPRDERAPCRPPDRLATRRPRPPSSAAPTHTCASRSGRSSCSAWSSGVAGGRYGAAAVAVAARRVRGGAARCSTRATSVTCSSSSAGSGCSSRTRTARRSARSPRRSSRRTPARARTRSASSATRAS